MATGRSKRPALLLAAVLALLSLALLPALLGTSVFYLHDIELWFEPSRQVFRERVVAGDFPLWQPQIGLGQPSAANPAQSSFYPGNLLLLLPDAGAVSRFIAAHVLLAAAGTWVLARTLGRSPSASAVAAASVGFAGYTLSMAAWSGTYLLSIAWVPLVVALGLRARRPVDHAWFALALACQITTGELQAVGTSLVLVVALALAEQSKERSRRRRLGWLALALVAGFLLAAPQLLPTLELLADSRRAGGLALAETQRLSFHPARLIELVAAGAHGSPLDPAFSLGDHSNQEIAGLSPTWTLSPYQGAFALGLAGVAIAIGVRRREPIVWVLAGVALVSLLLALGKHTPIHGWLTALPGLDLFRYPAKYLAVVSLCLALLAARGVDAIGDASERGRAVLIGLGVGAVAVFVLAGLARAGALGELREVAFARTGGWLALAALALALVRRAGGARRQLVLAGVITAELAVSNLGLVHTTDPALVGEPALAAIVIRDDHARRDNARAWPRTVVDPRVIAAGRGLRVADPEAAATQVKELLAPNLATAHGIAHPLPYAASLDERHQRWVEAVRERMRVAMDIYGIHYLVAPGVAEFHPSLGLELVSRSPEGNAAVFYNRAVRPLVYVADPVTAVADEDEAYRVLADRERVRARGAAIITDAPGAGATGTCELLARPADTVSARCELASDGWVVINVAYHRGWRATIDGTPAPIAVANGAVMAVAVPAGARDIRLAYHQPGLRLGLILAALAALGLLVAPLVARRFIRRFRRR